MATTSPLHRPEGAAERQGVEQRLGRMFVPAVAGVDHAAPHLLRQQRRGARGRMAHYQKVGLHGVQRHRGIDQRLALGDRGGARTHVDGVGAQAFGGDLERALSAGGAFEEEVHQGAPAQQAQLLLPRPAQAHESIGQIQQPLGLGPVQAPHTDEMAPRQSEHALSNQAFDIGRVSVGRQCGHRGRAYRRDRRGAQGWRLGLARR